MKKHQPYLALLLAAVGLAFLAAPALAGDDDPPGLPTQASLRAALVYGGGEADAPGVRREAGRSVPLAFALSAVLPGAGQAYNRNWVKAAIGLGLEAALVTGYVVWNADGRAGERAFRAFAHADWDPARYASWLNDYKRYQVEALGRRIGAPDVSIPLDIDFTNPGGWNATERLRVNQFFAAIRAIERESIHPETGASFSHNLPDFGDQQYYELIGKYFQFAPGWEDYRYWLDDEGNYNVAIDPETTGANGAKPNVSDTFFRYAADHKAANDLLRRASRLSMFFIVNHLLAGIDAAVSAKLHNDRLTTNLGLAYGANGEPQPVAVVRYRF